ncbi:MAG: hypothetical protein ACXWB2_13095 [Acidimicrobiales bacterium]
MSPSSSKSSANPALADYRGKTIGRADIEAKLRELQGEVEIIGEEAKSYALTVVAVVGVGIVALAFVLGRRRGRRNRTIVEVRRF